MQVMPFLMLYRGLEKQQTASSPNCVNDATYLLPVKHLRLDLAGRDLSEYMTKVQVQVLLIDKMPTVLSMVLQMMYDPVCCLLMEGLKPGTCAMMCVYIRYIQYIIFIHTHVHQSLRLQLSCDSPRFCLKAGAA